MAIGVRVHRKSEATNPTKALRAYNSSTNFECDINLIVLSSVHEEVVVNYQRTSSLGPNKADRCFTSEHRDVESIRLYADFSVVSLLASIEHKINV